MSGANMTGAIFYGTKLMKSFMNDVNLTDGWVSHANLSGATLRNAILTDCGWSDLILDGTDLSGALMYDGTIHD
jgi:uncharacterized protein YjbI with pentapeptide repeats